MIKSKTILTLLSVLILSFTISYGFAAWTEPTASPPEGNISAPINISSTGQTKSGTLTINADFTANRLIDTSSGNYYVDPANTGVSALLAGKVSIGTVENDATLHITGGVCITADATCTDPGSGNLMVGEGLGKINVGTIDPIFDINGTKYATYMIDFAGGTQIETAGILKIKNKIERDGKKLFTGVIDLEESEEGSNIWLFWQASNKKIDDLIILLTSNSDGKVWYEKDSSRIIVFGEKIGEVSYRLSAPRIDNEKWQNLAEDQRLKGIPIN